MKFGAFTIPGLQPESTRLIAVALGASLLTYAALEVHTNATRKKHRKALEQQATQSVYGPRPSGGRRRPEADSNEADEETIKLDGPRFDESLIREQLTRNYSFFGDEGMEKLRKGRVAIVGCGGVGSWAAVMLVRSGVSYIRLIDFDMVTLSSLNRHAVATLADVGTPKVFAMKEFFKKIAPWVQVDIHMELWKAGKDGEKLLNGDVDWVVDAIDNINTKVDLLKHCHSRGIKVFASMGAGAKCDPTRVQISDISNTYEDSLARSVRRRLRLDGIVTGIPVVYSTETPSDVKLLPLPEEEFQKGAVHELGPFDDFRVRTLPVIGPLPSLFGLHIATYILCELAGKPILNPLATKNRRKLYEKLLRELGSREAKLTEAGLHERLPIDEADVAYIFEDLNRGRSTIPPHPVLAKPHLVRWDHTRPLAVDNCVVVSPQDAKSLKAAGGHGADVEVWHDGARRKEVIPLVEKRATEAREWAMSLV